MFKKAQAAMEFLMTYGWAILVVLVVIGALAYFGVLSPATLLPEKCAFPIQLGCIDHGVETAAVTLILQNAAGRDMSIIGVAVSSDALGDVGAGGGAINNDCMTDPAGPPSTLANGQRDTFILDQESGTNGPCLFRETGRDKNRYNATVTFKWVDSPSITHQITGELLAKGP